MDQIQADRLEEIAHEEILKHFNTEPPFLSELCISVAGRAFRLGIEAERKAAKTAIDHGIYPYHPDPKP